MTSSLRILIAAVVTTVAVLVFAVTLVHAVFYAPDGTSSDSGIAIATSSVQQVVKVPGEYPVRLKIPSLGIDANVQHVGLGKSGNMAVPSNFTDVAWYRYGPVPGQVGSAVIDGHVDNGLGLPGVFKHLDAIHVGDIIETDAQNGTARQFVVDDIKSYPYQSVPTQQIFGATSAPMLTLITCTGVWVQGGDTYDHRLVVYARLKSS